MYHVSSAAVGWPLWVVVAMMIVTLSITSMVPAQTLSQQAAENPNWIVKEGQPQAQIVLAEKPTRTARLAARELQTFIRQISGATLPITAEPTGSKAMRMYVGRSVHTDALGLSETGLSRGAFRIASGKDWIAFIGADADFVPPEPWPRNPQNNDEVTRVMAEWDKRCGGTWGNPILSMHRNYSPSLDLWLEDGRGSINAVYHYLESLGVRWYYPDQSGMVLPKLETIALSNINITSQPDFPLRHFLVYYQEFFTARPGNEPFVDRVRWQLWLGLTSIDDIIGPAQGHGTMLVTQRDETKKAHPEYYSLRDGRRLTDHDGYGMNCLSSEGLLQENVRFLKAAYDVLGAPMFCVAPADSFVLCECDLCKGKDDPDKGFKGNLSNYVWSYTDRVAREVYKTHPDKKVQCIAYVPYLSVPEKIEMFSPNLVVGMTQWRSMFFDRTERDAFRKLRREWLAKLPSKTLWTWDYYLHGWEDRSQWVHVPTFFPRLIAEDLRDLKGISLGDHVDVVDSKPGNTAWDAMAVNHLNAYVNAKLLWKTDTDLDALLNEYYEMYFGPAAAPMRIFIEYAEANWMNATRDHKVIDRFFELIAPAVMATGRDNVYAVRVARLKQYMQGLTPLRDRLAKGRGDAMKLPALGRDDHAMMIDGKLDDPFWQGLETYDLREVETGKPPQWATTFKVGFKGSDLCIGINCVDRDTDKLNITTRSQRSPSVWDGDNVEILLETQNHAYYQLAINPAGALVEADRKSGVNTDWSSRSRVAVSVQPDGWSLEVVIPAAGEEAASVDPLRGVSGKRPSETFPWYINICRQRLRSGGKELSALSPTGKADFHDVMKFAVLWVP